MAKEAPQSYTMNMPIFKNNGKLTPVKEKKFKLESELQSLVEGNLGTLLGLEFISTEFRLNNLRIDTLAFDKESSSFTIIEYKRDRSFSVIDQGYAYLALMLNNKADFILEYNEQSRKSLVRTDVDWSQSKVIFIANSFTDHQREAINFKDLPIEMWEARQYDDNIFSLNQIRATKAAESINVISGDNTVKKVAREVKQYTVDAHFKDGWDSSREIYDELIERLLALDTRMEVSPQKNYIGLKIDRSVVMALRIYKSKVRLELYRVTPKDVKDPANKVSYIEGSMDRWSKHVSVYPINEGAEEEYQYAVSLASQILNKFFP